MKRYCILAVLSLFWMNAACFAQENNNGEKIYLQVCQPERKDIPQEASRHLEQLLQKLVTSNGIMEQDPSNRFVLTSKASVVTKDILPGPPAKVSMNIDFTIMVGDIVENKVFESAVVSTVGVGINENKAFIAAVKSIKPRNKELVDFLEKAKQKIVQYYSSKGVELKKEAEKEAASHNYQKAIYLLSLVPSVCKEADECRDMAIQYHREYREMNALELLNRAKARWAESPNAAGASVVADILEEIPSGTSSQKHIDALTAEITEKLKSDEKRDWDFKMEKYRNRVEKQKRDDAARLEQQRADNELRSAQQAADNARRAEQQRADNEARKQEIEACRQVGLEWAKNQPKEVTYQNNIILW